MFIIVPKISHNYLIIFSSGTVVTTSSTYSSHNLQHPSKYNSLRCGKYKGTSAKHPLPTNIQKHCCITIKQGYISLEAQHISSALTHHIHNSASDFNLNFYSTAIVIAVLKVGNF